jgi:murein DD-endopeptidase MepM/ murein hydrolase activator NlpD
MRKRRRLLGWVALAACMIVSSLRAGTRLELVWPTPNPAWARRAPLGEILQQAGSGDPESGGFGSVRNGGHRFHEGLDIKCLKRDRRGEPADPVFAAMDGVVRHVSSHPGDSNYGRYVVLEHPGATPQVYTLYAHLASIAPGLKVGDRVGRGQTLGIMGHSTGATPIPRERAHLHFEIGVMMTRDFQRWYDGRKFGSRNEHGIWNGMNLMGIDPLDFYNRWRAREVDDVIDYLRQQPPAVRLRIAISRTPDFVSRYPALLTKPLPATIGGWEVACTWTGLPYAWTPLTPLEALGLTPNRPKLIAVDSAIERRERSKTLAVRRRGDWVPGHDLETMLQLVFSLR